MRVEDSDMGLFCMWLLKCFGSFFGWIWLISAWLVPSADWHGQEFPELLRSRYPMSDAAKVESSYPIVLTALVIVGALKILVMLGAKGLSM